jgi:hypothetical protein
MCGIVGVAGLPDAARLAYLGLYALQHRGQESAGIVAIDREGMARSHRGMGLVAENFDDETLAEARFWPTPSPAASTPDADRWPLPITAISSTLPTSSATWSSGVPSSPARAIPKSWSISSPAPTQARQMSRYGMRWSRWTARTA